jgi:Ku70/Ku80 beta-barrel domain
MDQKHALPRCDSNGRFTSVSRHERESCAPIWWQSTLPAPQADACEAAPTDAADIIKGYEVGKGDYIELDPEELEAVATDSKRTIDINEFVPKDVVKTRS